MTTTDPIPTENIYLANNPLFIRSLDKEARNRLIESEREYPPRSCTECIFYKIGFNEENYRDLAYDTCTLGAKPIWNSRPAACPLIRKENHNYGL